MAEAALRGEVPTEAPTSAAPEGLAALSGQALADLKAGLQQKEVETRTRVKLLEVSIRGRVWEVLLLGAAAIATRYAQILREAAHLHVLLDAADALLNGSGKSVTPPGWRQEVWLAPEVGEMRRDGSDLHRFDDGAGIVGAIEQWRAAVKATVGEDF